MLAGGDEFKPGNEAQDRFLIDRRGSGPAYLLVTANSKHPDMAMDFGRRWFTQLGLNVAELRVRTSEEAHAASQVELARKAGLFYLAGGNPGHIVEILKGTPVWQAMVEAWKGGAALAGSSAGAMAFGEWTLVEAPGKDQRRPLEALGLLPYTAVLPHFSTSGRGWIPSVRQVLGPAARLVGIDERTAYIKDGEDWNVLGQGDVHLEI